MNATLAELKLVVNQPTEEGAEPPQPSNPTALWEAITKLDVMMVNNTVNVSRSQPITCCLITAQYLSRASCKSNVN